MKVTEIHRTKKLSIKDRVKLVLGADIKVKVGIDHLNDNVKVDVRPSIKR